MKLAAVVVLGLLGPAHHASADPYPMVPAPESPGELSESTALALSLGGTAVSWAMVLSNTNDSVQTIGAIGTFVAPSFGHWYAGDVLTRGMGMRALGIVAGLTGAVMAFSQCPLFDDDGDCESDSAVALILLGTGLYVAGTIDDIANAPDRVRERNERARFGIVPIVRRDSGGLAVAGRF